MSQEVSITHEARAICEQPDMDCCVALFQGSSACDRLSNSIACSRRVEFYHSSVYSRATCKVSKWNLFTCTVAHETYSHHQFESRGLFFIFPDLTSNQYVLH